MIIKVKATGLRESSAVTDRLRLTTKTSEVKASKNSRMEEL